VTDEAFGRLISRIQVIHRMKFSSEERRVMFAEMGRVPDEFLDRIFSIVRAMDYQPRPAQVVNIALRLVAEMRDRPWDWPKPPTNAWKAKPFGENLS